MTGICYFTEKPTEYLAEMQVDAVVRYTEDDAVTLKMEGNFSPEKADKLIEKAISDNCDNLVFITENKNVNILNRLIPQEYGRYFENITVLEENYDRLTENDGVAATAVAGQAAQAGQSQAQTGTQNANGNGAAKPAENVAGNKVVFVCNAAAPNVKSLQTFINDRNKIFSTGIQGVTVDELKSAETWFSNVDSAGLTAANIHYLYENHPSDAIRKTISNANISKEGFDANIENLVTMAQSSKTVQSNHKYYFILPKGTGLQSKGNVIISELPRTYEHPNNKAILPLIGEVAKMIQNPKAEVKKRNDLPKEEEELTQQLKKDQAKLKFIMEYAKAFEWWTKNKDGCIKTKEAESQFEKAVKEFVFADFNNAWNALKSDSDKGIKFMANSIDKMVKGIKQDLKGKKDEDDKDKQSKKEETNSRNIFSWEKYPQLCKLLFEN